MSEEDQLKALRAPTGSSRNSPCSCGSGRKAKKCCFSGQKFNEAMDAWREQDAEWRRQYRARNPRKRRGALAAFALAASMSVWR